MGRVPDDVVNQLREGSPIEDVIGEYIPLRKAGSTFKALCPFHDEKTPSFNVNPRMGIFKCFGCGVGGDAIKFLMQHEGLNFREALQNLANRQGVDLSRYETEDGETSPPSVREKIHEVNLFAARYYWVSLRGGEGSRALSYIKGRDISADAMEAFRIGYAPARWDALCQAARQKGYSPQDMVEAGLAIQREDGSGFYDRFRDRVMFPILGADGAIVGFGGRSLPDSDARHATAKYINSPDTPAFRKGRVLYGFSQGRETIRSEKRAVVTEGYFDVIALWQSGIQNAVAPLGTALTAEHLRTLRAHAEELIFVFDSDQAGQAASERAGGMAGRILGLAGAPDQLVAGEVLRENYIDRRGLGAIRLKVMDLPRGQDVDDVLKAGGADSVRRLLGEAEGLLEHTVRKAIEGVAPGADQSEKLSAVQNLMPVLGASHQSVRDQYFSLLEDRLGIPYPALAESVRRMLAEEAREPTCRVEPAADLLGRSVDRPRLEVDAVRMLLVRPDLAGGAEVDPSIFADPAVREIVAAIIEAGGEDIHPAGLAERLTDPSARALVLDLAAGETPADDLEGEFSDCMARIQEKVRRRREEKLIKEIEDVSRSEGNDSPAVRRLLEEKNALLRERQKTSSEH
ncbi:MAG: DNA primase [Nitrospinota bacterium]|nr:DNA primase [Nitrospinota bacterium]